MANALARVSNVDIDMDGLSLELYVAFSGPDVNAGVGALDFVKVRLLATDSAVVVRSKMSSAVAAFGQAQGWVIAGADMTLPTFQKG